MVTSREPIRCDIELDGEKHTQADKCKYLGSILGSEGECKVYVETRFLKAIGPTGLLPTFIYTWAQ